MWQNIITVVVVGIALFYIGRMGYRQFRQIIDPSKDISCSCSCSGCSCGSCSSRKEEE